MSIAWDRNYDVGHPDMQDTYSDGDDVATWEDYGGYDGSQGTAARQASFQEDEFNGAPGLEFAGGQGYGVTEWVGGAEFAVEIVGRFDTLPDGRFLLDGGDGWLKLEVDAGGDIYLRMDDGNGHIISSSTFEVGQKDSYFIQKDNTNGVRMWKGRTLIASAPSATGGSFSLTVIGNKSDYSDGIEGLIARVRAVASAPSQADREDAINQTVTRYGIDAPTQTGLAIDLDMDESAVTDGNDVTDFPGVGDADTATQAVSDRRGTMVEDALNGHQGVRLAGAEGYELPSAVNLGQEFLLMIAGTQQSGFPNGGEIVLKRVGSATFIEHEAGAEIGYAQWMPHLAINGSTVVKGTAAATGPFAEAYWARDGIVKTYVNGVYKGQAPISSDVILTVVGNNETYSKGQNGILCRVRGHGATAFTETEFANAYDQFLAWAGLGGTSVEAGLVAEFDTQQIQSADGLDLQELPDTSGLGADAYQNDAALRATYEEPGDYGDYSVIRPGGTDFYNVPLRELGDRWTIHWAFEHDGVFPGGTSNRLAAEGVGFIELEPGTSGGFKVGVYSGGQYTQTSELAAGVHWLIMRVDNGQLEIYDGDFDTQVASASGHGNLSFAMLFNRADQARVFTGGHGFARFYSIAQTDAEAQAVIDEYGPTYGFGEVGAPEIVEVTGITQETCTVRSSQFQGVGEWETRRYRFARDQLATDVVATKDIPASKHDPASGLQQYEFDEDLALGFSTLIYLQARDKNKSGDWGGWSRPFTFRTKPRLWGNSGGGNKEPSELTAIENAVEKVILELTIRGAGTQTLVWRSQDAGGTEPPPPASAIPQKMGRAMGPAEGNLDNAGVQGTYLELRNGVFRKVYRIIQHYLDPNQEGVSDNPSEAASYPTDGYRYEWRGGEWVPAITVNGWRYAHADAVDYWPAGDREPIDGEADGASPLPDGGYIAWADEGQGTNPETRDSRADIYMPADPADLNGDWSPKEARAGCSISSSSTTLTSTGSVFSADDVGRVIDVPGAGSGGETLTAVIDSYTAADEVELDTAASTTVSNKTVYVWWAKGVFGGPDYSNNFSETVGNATQIPTDLTDANGDPDADAGKWLTFQRGQWAGTIGGTYYDYWRTLFRAIADDPLGPYTPDAISSAPTPVLTECPGGREVYGQRHLWLPRPGKNPNYVLLLIAHGYDRSAEKQQTYLYSSLDKGVTLTEELDGDPFIAHGGSGDDDEYGATAGAPIKVDANYWVGHYMMYSRPHGQSFGADSPARIGWYTWNPEALGL